jgi:proteasome accessory factor A
VNADLALDDPLDALARFSRDVDLSARAQLVGGGMRTAVELQRGFLEEARRFWLQGRFDGVVPEAGQLIALWDDTIAKLEAQDFASLSRRLDWVLKRRLLQSVLDRRPDLTWQSPALKHLDQMYASLDEADGLFWAVERAGQVERLVDEHAIDRARREPAPDTRAWTRAQLLRLAGAHRVDRVDWDRVCVRIPSDRWPYFRRRTVHLPLPFGATRAEHAAHFAGHAPLSVVLEALQASDDSPWGAPTDRPHKFWTVHTGETR